MENLKDILKYTKSMTLLYVEDDKEVRNNSLEALNDLFENIVVAIDGEDGLEKFFDNQIDLVLTDVNMPNLNGLDMAEKILEFDSNVPIIINSAYDEKKYFTKAIELNIDGYILKPLDISILLKTLKKVIKKINFQEEFQNNINLLNQYQDLMNIYSAVSKTDLNGTITYVNKEFCKLSGYTKEELIGNNHNIVRHEDNSAAMFADIWHSIKVKKEAWQGLVKNRSKDGATYYADICIMPILDSDNNIVEYISLRKNVTDIMSPKKQLYDFVETASEPLLVMVKTNDFEDIEKYYGFKMSQKIAEKFAENLFELMPKHLGFDKFLPLGNGMYVFVQDIGVEIYEYIDSLEDELRYFQKLVDNMTIDIAEIDYDVSIVISISSGKECIENVYYGIKKLEENKKDLITATNLAQREQEKALNNLKVLKMVKKALDDSKIISYFQPVICNKTQKIVKYESLVRLIDEDNNVISPFSFLDIAKKGKYYSKITNAVLENSFEALNQTDKSISINISAIDIEKETTSNKIFELLQKHKNDAHRIVFELLEDESVKDFDKIMDFIFKVKEYGVKIAIDDFGTGYSNLKRLLEYQPDILKIDGSLIQNIETDDYSLALVKTIISFAKEQKIEMIAEFIENENIYNIMKDLGVEYSQGYYFGKPALLEV